MARKNNDFFRRPSDGISRRVRFLISFSLLSFSWDLYGLIQILGIRLIIMGRSKGTNQNQIINFIYWSLINYPGFVRHYWKHPSVLLRLGFRIRLKSVLAAEARQKRRLIKPKDSGGRPIIHTSNLWIHLSRKSPKVSLGISDVVNFTRPGSWTINFGYMQDKDRPTLAPEKTIPVSAFPPRLSRATMN